MQTVRVLGEGVGGSACLFFHKSVILLASVIILLYWPLGSVLLQTNCVLPGIALCPLNHMDTPLYLALQSGSSCQQSIV